MNVPPVDDELDRDPVIRERNARQPHLALMQRRHAVEQMRAVRRARVDRPERLHFIRHAVSHRRLHTVFEQKLDELLRIFELGGEGQDLDQPVAGLDQFARIPEVDRDDRLLLLRPAFDGL